MLDPLHLHATFTEQRHRLMAQDIVIQTAHLLLNDSLKRLAALPLEDVQQRLLARPWHGPWPTAEWPPTPQGIVPFVHDWHSHAAGLRWARSVLQDVPVTAVAAASLPPRLTGPMPIGLVQVGWVADSHAMGQPPIQERDHTLITLDEITADGRQPLTSTASYLIWRTFEQQIQRLITVIRHRAGDEPPPLCLLAGSFALPSIRHLPSEEKRPYNRLVDDLLSLSADRRIPFVAVSANSQAQDIVGLLTHLAHNGTLPPLSDAALFQNLLHWGDRSPMWQWQPDDESGLLFCYLQTAPPRPPVRLELPAWILANGRLEPILNQIRADCLLGGSYPATLNAARSLAALTARDQQRFYAAVEQFIRPQGPPLRPSSFAPPGKR